MVYLGLPVGNNTPPSPQLPHCGPCGPTNSECCPNIAVITFGQGGPAIFLNLDYFFTFNIQ